LAERPSRLKLVQKIFRKASEIPKDPGSERNYPAKHAEIPVSKPEF
jgi:hypothetical protein